MFVAITVLGLAIQMGTRRAALLASRARLYALWLSYYRIQTIPTCVRAVEDDGCDDDDDREESEGEGHRRG